MGKKGRSGKDWVPRKYNHLKDPRSSIEPGTPPYLAPGLMHSESPLDPANYLSPVHPDLPGFVGPPPTDARRPVENPPSLEWSESVIIEFSKAHAKLRHLALPSRIKGAARAARRDVDEGESDTDESESDSDSEDSAEPMAKRRKKDAESDDSAEPMAKRRRKGTVPDDDSDEDEDDSDVSDPSSLLVV